MRILRLPLLLLALAAGGAAAADSLNLEGGWVRAMPPGSTMTAAYLSLDNGSRQAQRFLGAHSPRAKKVALHRTRMEEGMMKMEPVKELALAAGERLELAPGGLHLMLMGLEDVPREGEAITLTLEFKGTEPLSVSLPVRRSAPSR